MNSDILNKSTKAVLWDLDGTIADTLDLHFKAWEETFLSLNIPFSIETQQATFGMNATGIVEHHYGYLPPNNELQKVIKGKERLFRDIADGHVSLFQNVEKILKYYQHQNILQVIASSAPLLNITALLNGLGIANYFVDYFSGDELPAKPSPELFLTAANSIKITPNHCLVIEDSISGVAAAKNAGMKCVAVTFTHIREELHQADLVIDKFSELINAKI
jgi:HAD superfamily hydrolase (TIGR01509 family)